MTGAVLTIEGGGGMVLLSYFELCAPRMRALLERGGVREVHSTLGGWRVVAGGRARVVHRTEIEELAAADAYSAIDDVMRCVVLDLSAAASAAARRRAFRTRQRSLRSRRAR
jgi:hypothetical protein